MAVNKKTNHLAMPMPGWAIYLRTSSDENQKPELSRARQRFAIQKNVLERSEMPVYGEYVDVLTGKTPNRKDYQRLLSDARLGKFSHVIVERADRFGRNDTEALRAIDELHEFGVAVRFANQPDLDPMDPDDRVIVTLSFTLARRETLLLGVRVKGGMLAKMQNGGFATYAPDGYLNKSKKSDAQRKHDVGRYENFVELDAERAVIWRYAWDLLLEDKWTLLEIAELLHEKGYRYRTGRPFIEIHPNGHRKANINTLSRIFHNWAYAGWVVSEQNNIPPKTLRGNWKPIVSTEEFELGERILAHRSEHRTAKRVQDYFLGGIVFFRSADQALARLTGSTSNSGRIGGGTKYYRQSRRGGVNFLCRYIDDQVHKAVASVHIKPELLPKIRNAYQQNLKSRLVRGSDGQQGQLQSALKAVDDEEARAIRLYVSKKITEEVWDGLWAEWQDRRRKIAAALEVLEQEYEHHVTNLDDALKIIAELGTLYNGLEYSDRKRLLRELVEKVVVDSEGNVTLELKTPFEYLQNLANDLQKTDGQMAETKNSGLLSAVTTGTCSIPVPSCVPGGIRTPDFLLRRQTLYPLSYRHMNVLINVSQPTMPVKTECAGFC